MAQLIQLKRSAVAGRVPTTANLALGELAINVRDGKLYFQRDDSTIQSILTTNASITGDLTLVGTVTATSFIGDGSQLTGIAATLQEVTDNGATTTNTVNISSRLTLDSADYNQHLNLRRGVYGVDLILTGNRLDFATTASTTQFQFLASVRTTADLQADGNADIYGSYLNLGRNLSTAEAAFTVGQGRTGDGFSYIDLVGDTTYTDYGARFIRGNSGANASTQIRHRGTGFFDIYAADNAAVRFVTNSLERMRVAGDGNVGIGVTTPLAKLDIDGGSSNPLKLTTTNNDAIEFRGASASSTPFTFIGYNSRGFRFWDSVNAEIFKVANDGDIILSKYGIGNKIGSGNPAYALAVDASGNIIETAVQSVPTGGSGTDNYIAKWVGTSELGNSNIFDDGTNVGIGTATPAAPLSVFGTGGTVFDVQGSQGQLFSITDSLTGSLMSVNDISGLPILEVFDTDKVVMGEFGTNALVVTGSNVGIGTENPSQKLHVDGNIRATGAILDAQTFSTVDSTFNSTNTTINSTNIIVGNNTTDHVYVGNTTMYISDGNVGIGTTSPLTKLDIRTDTGVLVKGASGSTDARIALVPATGGRQYGIRNYGSSFGIKDESADNMRLYFHYNGHTGIGTSAPSRKLHVVGGDVYVPTTSDVAGVGSFGGNSFEIRNSTTGEHFNLDIYNRTTSTWTTPFHIQNTGNVGIGTTSPSQKLHVNGSIAISPTSGEGLLFVGGAAPTGLTWYNGGGTTDGPQLISYGSAHIIIDSDGNDADTRFFSVSKNGTNYANATELFRIQENGNVGIGTDSPTSKLHVYGASATINVDDQDVGNPGFKIMSGTALQASLTSDTATGNTLMYVPNGKLTLQAGETEVTGNLTVGGTITAQEFRAEFITNTIILESGSTQFGDSADDTHNFTGTLDVTGDVNIDGNLSFYNSGYITNGGTGSGALDIIANGTTGNGNITINPATSNDALYLNYLSGGDIRLGFNGTKGNFTEAGNLGIGTVSPTGQLHINKENAEATLFITRGGTDLAPNTDIGTIEFQADYQGSPISYGGIDMYANSGSGVRSSLGFKVKSTTGNIETGLVVRGGSETPNVGINTSSPDGKLDVRGTQGRWRINGYGGMYFRNDSDTGYTRYIHPRSDGSLSFGRILDTDLSSTGANTYATTAYDHFYLDASGTAYFNGGINFAGVNGQNFVVDTDGQRIIWEHQRNGLRRMTFYHEADQDVFNFNFESGNQLQINGSRIITESDLGSAASSAATDFVAVTGDTMTGNLVLNKNTTIGGTNPSNGNLQITDGAYVLGIDSNEIHSTNAMYIGTNSGNLILRPAGDTTITNGKLGVGTATPGYLVEATGTIRATSSSPATGVGGAGLEVRYNTTDQAGSLLSYDRGNSVYKELRLEGSVIAIREAGSEVARFNAGRLGIGTTSPTSLLHLNKPDSSGAGIDFTNSDATSGLFIGVDSAEVASFWYRENKDMKFATNATERIRISADGKVGIGKNGMTYSLELGKGDSGNNVVMGYYDTAGTRQGFVGVIGTAGDFVDAGAEGDFFVRAQQKLHLSAGTTGNYQATMDTAGNFGIGTSSPSQKLHVVGKALITDDVQLTGSNPRIDFNTNGASSLRFFDTTNAVERMRINESGYVGIGDTAPSFILDTNITNSRARFKANSGDANLELSSIAGHDWLIQSKADGELRFYDEDAASARLSITAAGNVGIGTTSPARQLHVYGEGILRVDSSNVGDPGIDFNVQGANQMQIRYRGTQSILTVYSYGTTSNVVAIAKNTGNVGIGTETPSSALHVKGVTTIEDTAKVSQTGRQVDGDPAGTSMIALDGNLYVGAFIDYTIYDTTKSSMRSGTVQVVFDGVGNAQFTDNSTLDIGDTTPAVFDVDATGVPITRVLFVAPDPDWHVRYHVRYL